jgi:hypothetical protein
MLIHILRTGSHYDYIKDFMLDSLIESNRIDKFKRSTGWVSIGADPIRGIKRDAVFNGANKRAVFDLIVI